NADRPEGRMNLANLYAARGDAGGAIVELRKAIKIDPTSVETRVNLADLYRARGVESEAEGVLRQGLVNLPRAAPLHHALGLTLVRQKRHSDAHREVEQAAKLAPGHARYANVYEVSLSDN